MSNSEETVVKTRTKDCGKKHKKLKDTLTEMDFDYRQYIITTTFYCTCHDCLKYCNYREPVQCIDPYLMDMGFTDWIYHGLVSASKTERAIVIPDNN